MALLLAYVSLVCALLADVVLALVVLGGVLFAADAMGRAFHAWNRRIQRSPYRVPCPRCGANVFERCRGLQYETHIARDRQAIELYLDERL